MRAAPPGTISGRINVSPLLPGDGHGADLCARLERGAQVFVKRDVRLRRGRALAHDDGVCTGEHRLHAVRFCKAYAHRAE